MIYKAKHEKGEYKCRLCDKGHDTTEARRKHEKRCAEKVKDEVSEET